MKMNGGSDVRQGAMTKHKPVYGLLKFIKNRN
jgi:hypothetical protein